MTLPRVIIKIYVNQNENIKLAGKGVRNSGAKEEGNLKRCSFRQIRIFYGSKIWERLKGRFRNLLFFCNFLIRYYDTKGYV